MYFDDATDPSPIAARADNRALLSLNGLALLAFGVLPQPLLGLCVVALANSGLL
jgi:NADH-quinone oxidoreductase subunit N